MMKRGLRVGLLGSAAVLLSLGGLVQPALAAGDTVKPATTTATAELTAGDGTVALTQTPDIDFGQHAAPNGSAKGAFTAKTVSAPIEVNDPGIGKGWNLQVSNTAFTDATSGAQLQGAQLGLGVGAVKATNADNPSTAPTGQKVTLNGDSQNQTILTAPNKGGLGTWQTTYQPADVTLTVPAGQLAGKYSSTLTWQLGNTVQ